MFLALFKSKIIESCQLNIFIDEIQIFEMRFNNKSRKHLTHWLLIEQVSNS